MKKIIVKLFLIVTLLFAVSASAQAFAFSDLQYWVGSGTNSAALVVSWNDGKSPDSLVWGYRWNTPVSGTNPTIFAMLQAIQSVDTRFQFTSNPKYATTSVYSVFFDLTGSGGNPVVGKPYNLGGTENGSPPYSGDHYREGWYTGFWGEVIGVGNPYVSGSWNSGSLAHGVGVDRISNNSWYGLSFSLDESNFTIPNPGFPTPVSIPVLTFLQWQTKNSLTGGGADTPLNDGVPNLLKYLFNINPGRPMNGSDRAALPVLGTTSLSGTQYLTLTYRQNQLITGLAVNVQITSDLQSWSTITPDFTQQTGTDPNTGDPIIEVKVHVTNESRNFIRLNAVSQ